MFSLFFAVLIIPDLIQTIFAKTLALIFTTTLFFTFRQPIIEKSVLFTFKKNKTNRPSTVRGCPRKPEFSPRLVTSRHVTSRHGNPGCLWSQLQASKAISEMLGDEAVCCPSDRSYLDGLAEAYKNSTAWETRRQIFCIICHGRHRKLQSKITFYSWDNAESLHYGQLTSSPIW